MPRIPQKTPQNINGANLLNAVRNDIGGAYKQQVPQALNAGDVLVNGRKIKVSEYESLASLRAIGNVLHQNLPLMNQFLDNLINRIAMVIISSRLYENPWAKFKKGILEYGETVEEIFVSMAQGYQYDPDDAEKTLHQKYIPDVKAAYHSLNFQKYYPTSDLEDSLKMAFLSWEGVSDLLTKIIEQVYTGAAYDELMVTKYMLAKQALNGDIYSINIPDPDSASAKDITTLMLTTARNLSIAPSAKYNRAGVPTYTDKSYLQFILTTDISSLLDVNVLALSFNMDKATLIGNQTYIDDFGTFDNVRMQKLFENDPYTNFTPFTQEEMNQLNSIKGLMCDINFFMIFDNMLKMTEWYNPKGLYRNYFLHKWTTFSTSPFANAILFTTETPEITSLSITPSTASASKGQNVQFTALIENSGFASKKVLWEITGESASTIDSTGLVRISQKETETTLTVKCTSIFDETKSATATISII